MSPSETRDDTTRDQLLDAAERLFAEKGLDATSVREITSAAGANVASVNYYFGGKENLYQEVFRRRLAAVREYRLQTLRDALDGAGDSATVETVVRAFVWGFLRPLIEHSEGWVLVELMAREMTNNRLPREVFHQEMIRPMQESFASALRRVEPRLTVLQSVGCFFSVMAQVVQVVHLYRMHGGFPMPGGTTRDVSGIAEHIVRFSAHGVRGLVSAADGAVPPGTGSAPTDPDPEAHR